MEGMEPTSELAEVKKELALVRLQLDELRQFLKVEEREDVPGNPKSLSVFCTGLFLYNQDNPDQLQGLLVSGKEGPTLSLWGRDEKMRVKLAVLDDVAQLELFTKDFKP